MRTSFRSLSISLLAMLMAITSPTLLAATPEWTFLVFMNGKNNLEDFAVEDFLEMAKVGSNERIHMIVQMGRLAGSESTDYGDWGGVKRFKVAKDMSPTEEAALSDLGSGKATDMGDGKVLEDFLTWGIKNYPAKRYAVVIWNHGQGWRLQLNKARPAGALEKGKGKESRSSFTTEQKRPKKSDVLSGTYRSISTDDEFGTILYNSDVTSALTKAFGKRKVDLMGYDACLMGMVETAYSLVGIADVMVASEELEPGTGWDYELVLKRLNAATSLDSKTFGKEIVAAYQERYTNVGTTTLSAIDVQKIVPLADAIDSLSSELVGSMEKYRPLISNARSPLKTYATSLVPSLKSSVDLIFFLEKLQEQTKNTKAEALAATAAAAVADLVLANYRSKRRDSETGFGSKGLAIFFPKTHGDLMNDPDADGYAKNNKFKPVKFVAERKWPVFLHAYLGD